VADDENSKNESSWGGARAGAGRPVGKQNAFTMERAAIKQAFEERVAANADGLFNFQMTLAQRTTYLFRIHTDSKGNKGTPELVDSQAKTSAYLNGEYDREQGDYHFITTGRPDTRVIYSVLDRAFGKACRSLSTLTLTASRYRSWTWPKNVDGD
jgi:hypothetical protein